MMADLTAAIRRARDAQASAIVRAGRIPPRYPNDRADGYDPDQLTCPVCGFQAGNPGGLVSHRRRHRGEQ